MCGLFAINKTGLSAQEKTLVKQSIDFRGPDFQSDFIEHRGWTLYHSRLAIIGLDDNYNQPYFDVSGGALLFNGEILNFQSLGTMFFTKNYQSDTHLLSDLIINKKLSLEQLNGFFSFIYINNHGQLLFAARDSFGVKPLFYYKAQNLLAFSSEAAVFNRLYNCDFSSTAMEEYRCLRYPIFSQSYFNNVYEVPPGSCHITGTYFSVLDDIGRKYSPVNTEVLETIIQSSVESRAISDVGVGLLLSKGIDSNLLKSVGKYNSFFSIGFKGDEDLTYVKYNVNKVNMVECDPTLYRETFFKLRRLRGEPLSVPNEVLLYLIARNARQNDIKVLHSGEGADEFFGGYDRVFRWALALKAEFNLHQFLTLYCYQPPVQNSELYQSFQDLFKKLKGLTCFEKVRFFFIRYHLPILFRRLDFSLMAAGVEGREPLATLDIFKAATKLSAQTLVNDKLGKIPLRSIMEKHMGKAFATSEKVGFPVNLQKIFTEYAELSNYEIWFELNRT